MARCYRAIRELVKCLGLKDRILLANINKLIDEWDILDLWKSGCPPDEYESEAITIFTILKETGDIEKVREYFIRYTKVNPVPDMKLSDVERILSEIEKLFIYTNSFLDYYNNYIQDIYKPMTYHNSKFELEYIRKSRE